MQGSKPKVLIVGAGPGGLASAMLLARAGADVTVIEKQSWVGGRTATLKAEGFQFDLGPTFFLYPRILSEIYSAAGFDLRAEVPMVKLDPQYRLVFGSGGELLATPDIKRMEESIAKLCPHDALNFRAFIEENREKLERFRPCLESPFSSWRDLCTARMMKLMPLLRPWLSLDGELGRHFADPRMRLAFSFQSKYLGMSPFRCPSLFSILAFLEYDSGVWHPIGGCGAVPKSMASLAMEMGVKFRLAEGVEELRFNGRRICGARTRAGEYKADAVVINADFAQAMKSLVPDHLRNRWTNRKIAKKRFSCSTFMLYLGISGRYDNVAHHSIYIAKDYERNLDDIEQRHILSDDPSFYVQNACVTDRTLAPAGMSTLYVLVPVTHNHANVEWSKETIARYRAIALKQLHKIGIHDVESRIRYERIVTPDDWEQTFDIYKGATFNLSHSLDQMLHLRPNNRFEDLDGVYLTGGGTHPGSGLPVIFESARISTKLLLEDFGMRVDWHEMAAAQQRAQVA
jgi:phytoene desaturase